MDTQTHPFQQRFGWLISIDSVAEMRRCKWEEVYEMKVIEFLNTLSYIKSKQAYENEQQQKLLKRK